MTKQRSIFVLLVLSFALGAVGCHSHTERIVERDVPTSSTTVVR